MTATPVKLLLKNDDSCFQNSETVYTMNNKNIYGDIIYEYSFYQGIKDKILVPFETIYFTQNNELPENIKQKLKGKDKKEKQGIYFKCISNFLIDAIKSKKLKHVLVYLQNQKKLKLMKQTLSYILKKNETFKCEVHKIISNMTEKDRQINLKAFRRNSNTPKILLSVGIFDEGVDEVCIDSVMFAEERNTESKIVQNIGRCLRVANGKDKSYVIIPNIIYEFNDTTITEINNAYSSHYKNIRNIISILNKDTKNHYYKKYVKGDGPDIEGEENEDNAEKCDEFVKDPDNNITIKNKEIDFDKIYDIYNYYTQQCSIDNNINNVPLSILKELIMKQNIKNIKDYVSYVENNNVPYKSLHQIYKSDWISWQHFFTNNVFSYDEAKNFIKNIIVTTFENSSEWIKYYENLLKNETNNKRDDNISDQFIENITKIPNRPKEYYKGDWVDWEDFLGSNIIKTTGLISNNPSDESNAETNLKILVNKDYSIISSLKKGQYNDIDINIDLKPLNDYFNNALGIQCQSKIRVLTTSKGLFDRCSILCKRSIDEDNFEPIIVYPAEKRFIYDTMVVNTEISFNENHKVSRQKEEYIQNRNVNNLLQQIIDQCRQYCDEQKNDEIITLEDKINKIDKIVKNTNKSYPKVLRSTKTI